MLTILEMVQNAVSFPDLALDKLSGNDPDRDDKSFLRTVETFHLDHLQMMLAKQQDISSEKLLSSLLRGRAAEWYEGFNTGSSLLPWIQARTALITRFSDDKDKYRHRITTENCVRGKTIIKNFYHRVKQAVGGGWPIDVAALNET